MNMSFCYLLIEWHDKHVTNKLYTMNNSKSRAKHLFYFKMLTEPDSTIFKQEMQIGIRMIYKVDFFFFSISVRIVRSGGGRGRMNPDPTPPCWYQLAPQHHPTRRDLLIMYSRLKLPRVWSLWSCGFHEKQFSGSAKIFLCTNLHPHKDRYI